MNIDERILQDRLAKCYIQLVFARQGQERQRLREWFTRREVRELGVNALLTSPSSGDSATAAN